MNKNDSGLFNPTISGLFFPTVCGPFFPTYERPFLPYPYSKEELVAELGTADLLHRLGIETPESFVNSAAYIQNWLQVLKNDSRFVVLAASKAEKAVNYILDEKDNTGDDHE